VTAICGEFAEDAAIHSHARQDVLARLDMTYRAFFRRVQRGEQAGFQRNWAGTRYRAFSCTFLA
jgi:putative transposase